MKKIVIIIPFIFLYIFNNQVFATSYNIKDDIPKVILKNIPTHFYFSILDQDNQLIPVDTSLTIIGIECLQHLDFKQGRAKVENLVFRQNGNINIAIPGSMYYKKINVIPPLLVLLPPLIAILLAFITRQVFIALFVGIWIGTSFIYNYNFFKGFFLSITDYIATAPADPDRMAIIIFSLVLGGMVGIITAINGTSGIVARLSRYASNTKRGQIATWLMGLIIFFDDYTNTLIVGNTMRPLTDKLRISREKLAFLVDSTAAPVANIAIISTWIGFEIGLIKSTFDILGIQDNAYLTFIKTIPYNFYPIFIMVFTFTIAILGRDFGPMYKAEIRARKTGKVLAINATPISLIDVNSLLPVKKIIAKWYNGIIPIFTVILTTIIGLWISGYQNIQASDLDAVKTNSLQYISMMIGKSNPYAVLMWAAFIGSIVAMGMALIQKILNLEQAILAWINGMKSMIIAVIILTLAWAIGNICIDLNIAGYLMYLSKNFLSAYYIPAITFLIAAIISFATGTSWGVMAIVMPIVIPIAYALPQNNPAISVIAQNNIFYSTIAAVLAGATFGDHCSPISDTTIMSSMSSCSDHIDHVRTQMPYALLMAILSIFLGFLPTGFGIDPLLLLSLGIIIIIVTIRFFAKRVE